MRGIGLVFLFILMASSVSVAWEKSFGGNDHDEVLSLVEVPNGDLIAVGITHSFGVGRVDCYVLRLDKNGNKLWERSFGGKGEDGGISICKAHEGGFVVAGFTESMGSGSVDVYLFKIDENGNKSWERAFGGGNVDLASSVVPTSDGGYIIAGMTESFGSGSCDAYVIKVDGNGNRVWEKTFGGKYYDEALSVAQTSDGGYIFVGVTKSFDVGDAYVVRLDKDGNKVWEKVFGGMKYEEATCLKVLPDGGFIVAGFTESLGSGVRDAYLLRLDKDGNKVWEKTFGGSGGEAIFSVDLTEDGGYVLVGWTDSFGAGKSDFYVLKVDKDGSKLWERTFGGAEDDIAYAVKATSDGGYVVAGWSASVSPDGNAYILKLDKDGNLLH